jgi:hypothetical protein
VHPETILALVLVLLTFAAHMLLPTTAERVVSPTAEPESVRHMRERVEALAAQLRAGEITFHDWQAQMAAFRSDAAA